MDHRGHPRSDAGRHSHRAKEDYHRFTPLDGNQGYAALDPRERDRHWAHPDAPYRGPYSGPPRPEQHPYNTPHYQYGYGHMEHQRPQSRHGYDYQPHSHWDYRDPYGYYDNDYYRGQHGRHEAGQWGAYDSWRTDSYQDRGYRPDHSGSSHTEEYSSDQGRVNSQHYYKDLQDHPSRDHEDMSSFYPGTLESSKNSGLSSSSYELSQYINGAEHSDLGTQSLYTSDTVYQMAAPLKFSIPHAVVSFGPAGQLIRVSPGLSSQENVSQLEIHSMEVILSNTNEQQEMRSFPGPLTREDLHKVDAMEFSHQRASACMRDDKLHDRKSAALLWNLLILLCRQNGQTVGSDIAELLMQGSHADGSSAAAEAPTLIDFNESSMAEGPPQKGDDLLTGNLSSFSSETSVRALQSYTKLLLAGRKKEALESAMSSGMWGHALFLASKMDNRSYTTVLSRFTGQLTPSDPLQTLFQLLSGRVPAVAVCCGNEKWGDWRPHLAVMLSNEAGDAAVQQKAIITMGDSLASKGLIHAAHVCYLTAGVSFGVFTQKAERLVLLGSSHRQRFQLFASNSAIQCTELYEYCQTLGGKLCTIPTFQVYKLLYACRLLDCGLPSQAFHYCEVIGQSLLRQREPFYVLTEELIKLSDRLRHSEGQFSGSGVSGAGEEPDWLRLLRDRLHRSQTGRYGSAEIFQPEGRAVTYEDSKYFSESDLHDRSSDIQSPEPELLYYRGPEEQEDPWHQEGNPVETAASSWDASGAKEWPPASPPLPVTVLYAPPVQTVAAGQDLSYHNTDSAEVKTSSPHCPQYNPLSEPDGTGFPPAAGTMMGGQILEVSTSQPELIQQELIQPKPIQQELIQPTPIQQEPIQQSVPQHAEVSKVTREPTKQSTKGGWFSGWFKSKPKDDAKESSEQEVPAQTKPQPVIGSHPPPPPASVAPAMFHPQASSAGINPFSRKAGQQLG